MRKKCIRCDIKKDPDEFNRNARRPDGMSAYCKQCERQRMKKYYDRTADRPYSAFLDALEEVESQDVYEQVTGTIEGVKRVLMQHGRKEYAAEHQAVEFVAKLVWNGINVPRREGG